MQPVPAFTSSPSKRRHTHKNIDKYVCAAHSRQHSAFNAGMMHITTNAANEARLMDAFPIGTMPHLPALSAREGSAPAFKSCLTRSRDPTAAAHCSAVEPSSLATPAQAGKMYSSNTLFQRMHHVTTQYQRSVILDQVQLEM